MKAWRRQLFRTTCPYSSLYYCVLKYVSIKTKREWQRDRGGYFNQVIKAIQAVVLCHTPILFCY